MNKENRAIDRLIQIVRILRSPEGCPWDRKQTHESLKPMLIEETSELLDAIDNADHSNMKEELGDILMHVVLHSYIAEEKGLFDFNDVANEVSDKMERRHPHIFGGREKITSSEDVVKLWNEIKAEEKVALRKDVNPSLLAKIPRNMPALTRAEMLQKIASEAGLDWKKTEGVVEKLNEEISELNIAVQRKNIKEIEEEVGDILFSIVNLCRFIKLNSAEALLQRSSDKFCRRFHEIEKIIIKDKRNFDDYSPEELDSLWNRVKSDTDNLKQQGGNHV